MDEPKYRGGCSPRMNMCKRDCLHRKLVDEYRIERHRQEMEEERETLGYATEIQRRRESGLVPITFQEWLIGHKDERDE